MRLAALAAASTGLHGCVPGPTARPAPTSAPQLQPKVPVHAVRPGTQLELHATAADPQLPDPPRGSKRHRHTLEGPSPLCDELSTRSVPGVAGQVAAGSDGGAHPSSSAVAGGGGVTGIVGVAAEPAAVLSAGADGQRSPRRLASPARNRG